MQAPLMKDDAVMHVLGLMVLVYVVAACAIILAVVGMIKLALFILTVPLMLWDFLRRKR